MKISLLALVACLVVSACVWADDAPAPVRIKAGKEMLVAEDAVDWTSIWCRGSDRLIYKKRLIGLFYYEVESKKTKFVAGGEYTFPIACTPDGEWLIYEDRDDSRPGLWRYEFKTNKRQKLSIEGYVAFDERVFSSSGGIRLYVYGRSPEALKMPDPPWEVVRLESGYVEAGSSDGTIFYRAYKDIVANRVVLVAEALVPEHKVVEIRTQFEDARLLFVDRQGKVYLTVDDDIADDRNVRCTVDVESKELSCETVFRGKHGPVINDFGILPDLGIIIFTAGSWADCLKVVRIGEEEKDAYCIVTPKPPYDAVSYSALSPDGKRVAYEASREAQYGGASISDLYILNLEH
jgi:hypothetical protein